MPELKLAKLPDRTPVKITVTVSPELNRDLQAYAEAYSEAYQSEVEPVSELIPYMLQDFLRSDRSFTKAKKAKQKGGGESTSARTQPASRRTAHATSMS
ncbi:MAG: DUF2274 domain-containing protein [Rhodospirillaceae bacterium]|nr:DUF2274 domain-containing protein [Rhodospirillaceae bacterium]